jgi:hypothetical protein
MAKSQGGVERYKQNGNKVLILKEIWLFTRYIETMGRSKPYSDQKIGRSKPYFEQKIGRYYLNN